MKPRGRDDSDYRTFRVAHAVLCGVRNVSSSVRVDVFRFFHTVSCTETLMHDNNPTLVTYLLVIFFLLMLIRILPI